MTPPSRLEAVTSRGPGPSVLGKVFFLMMAIWREFRVQGFEKRVREVHQGRSISSSGGGRSSGRSIDSSTGREQQQQPLQPTAANLHGAGHTAVPSFPAQSRRGSPWAHGAIVTPMAPAQRRLGLNFYNLCVFCCP